MRYMLIARGLGAVGEQESTMTTENPFKEGDLVKDNYGNVKQVLGTDGCMVTTWSERDSGTLGNTYHWTKLHLAR